MYLLTKLFGVKKNREQSPLDQILVAGIGCHTYEDIAALEIPHLTEETNSQLIKVLGLIGEIIDISKGLVSARAPHIRNRRHLEITIKIGEVGKILDMASAHPRLKELVVVWKEVAQREATRIVQANDRAEKSW